MDTVMKIVCPSCQAQYEVPEVVLTSRRKMRCARCGAEWVPADAHTPEPPAPVVEEAMAPVPEAVPEPAPAAPVLAAAEPASPEPPAHDEHFAVAAEPEMAWSEPEPPHQPAAEPESVLVETAPPPAPPRRPVAIRPDTPVSVRATLPDPAAIVVPPRAKGPPVMGWAISLALVVGLAASAVIYRAPIMKAWPPSTRLYAGLGLVQR